MSEIDNKKLKAFILKSNDLKKDHKLDLSRDEDLSIAIMNLVSIEEHFFFTAQKTGKNKYFDLLREVRQMRKELLKKIIKDYEGEVWCISKHLLAASYRLMEVGTKELDAGHKKEAYEMFHRSYDLYSLFWGLNLGVVKSDSIKSIDKDTINSHDAKKSGFFGKLGELVKKAIDCCLE